MSLFNIGSIFGKSKDGAPEMGAMPESEILTYLRMRDSAIDRKEEIAFLQEMLASLQEIRASLVRVEGTLQRQNDMVEAR